MDAVVFPSGSKKECSACAGQGHPNLMQCSKCRLARYCSSECQTADWPNHRGLCVDRETLFEKYAGLGVPVDVLRFLKWMDYWRLSVLRWALYSSDVAHQPVDFLAQNCFVLLLEARPPGSYLSVKATYSAVEHGMRSDAEIVDQLRVFPVVGHRDRLISDFRSATPTNTKVRMIVMTDSCYTVESADLSALFVHGQNGLFSCREDAQCRSLSTAMKWTYMDRFAHCIKIGRSKECLLRLDVAIGHIESIYDLV
ncbi:hypothetical protein C8R47DRAFT_1222053 [Mycena vitilis]|nr:hypothetical protein C8R47DRAFT_1222053 [Mycena vitilis]